MRTRTYKYAHKRPSGLSIVLPQSLSPLNHMERPVGVLQFDQPFWNHKSPKKLWESQKKKKGEWTNKNKKLSCVKTQLMSRWSQSVKLSWDTSGHGEEVNWWPVEDLAAKTSVQKCGCPPLTFWPLSSSWLLTSAHHISSFTTSPFFIKCPLDNTPSIWRWRTTHTCTVKTTSGKELSSVSCGSKTPLFLVLFFYTFTVIYQDVLSLLFFMSIKAGLRGPGKGLLHEDQSVTFQLQGWSQPH